MPKMPSTICNAANKLDGPKYLTDRLGESFEFFVKILVIIAIFLAK